MENSSITVNFGKHSGKTISQIAQEDMNWLIWIVNNYDVYAFSSPNRFARLKQSTIDYRLSLKREAKQYVEDHFKKIENENRQKSTSEYVGALRRREAFPVTIKKVRYESLIATTNEGNEIRFYDKEFNLKVGDQVTVIGTPTKYIEVTGVKQTYINRVKIQNS